MATTKRTRKRAIGTVHITAEQTKEAVKIRVEPEFIIIPVLAPTKPARKTSRARKPRMTRP